MFAGGIACLCASARPVLAAEDRLPKIALFKDAAEIVFSLADQRRATDPNLPAAPRRQFVKDATQAHTYMLSGTYPIVGMSLDDFLFLASSGDPRAKDLVVICGIHRGFLELIAAPSVPNIRALAGRKVAIDTDTGYASALFEICGQQGLRRDKDFSVVHAGATNLRFEKLLAGEFDATLLGAPYTVFARQQGYRSLASIPAELGGYQAIVLVAHRSWLKDHSPAARGISDCFVKTLAWARNGKNRTAVARLLSGVIPSQYFASAAKVQRVLFGPDSEFLSDGRMRDSDMRVVLDLFNKVNNKNLTLDWLKSRICYAPTL